MTFEELDLIRIKKPDPEIFNRAKKRWDLIAKPLDGLGEFENLVCRIAAIRGEICPDLSGKALLIMCADNGVVKEGVTQTGQEVTFEVAGLMGKKKSSVCVMTEDYPLEILPFDVGINSGDSPEGVRDRKIKMGSRDFLEGPAMSEEDCLKGIETGINAVKECREKGFGIIATGEMGIGNTTTATALTCALLNENAEDLTGRGSGLTKEGLERKIRVIERGLELHVPDRSDRDCLSKKETLRILSCLGGFDIAALCGVFMGGAVCGIPVVIDGLISAAAALLSERLLPGSREYMLASHLGRERAMEAILKELNLKAVIHADLALGEGTGAVLLFPMLDMAFSLFRKGTAFGETPIGQYERLK